MAAQLTARNGAGGAAAVLVEGAGDQLLARSAGAGDQHRHVLVGDAADGLEDLLHGRAAGDDEVGPLVHRPLAGHHRGDVHGPADGQRPADDLAHLTQLQRLEEVVEGAELHGLDGVVGVAAAADEDHRAARVQPAEPPQQFQPIQIGKVDIEDGHVRPPLAREIQPVGGGLGGQHLQGVVAERPAEGVQDGRLVVDDQQRGHVRAPKKRTFD